MWDERRMQEWKGRNGKYGNEERGLECMRNVGMEDCDHVECRNGVVESIWEWNGMGCDN